jgi:hypothetical protein
VLPIWTHSCRFKYFGKPGICASFYCETFRKQLPPSEMKRLEKISNLYEEIYDKFSCSTLKEINLLPQSLIPFFHKLKEIQLEFNH